MKNYRASIKVRLGGGESLRAVGSCGNCVPHAHIAGLRIDLQTGDGEVARAADGS